MNRPAPTPNLKNWYAARQKVAAAVLIDPVYVPIFERIEREIALLEKQDDAVSRARAVVANQSAVA